MHLSAAITMVLPFANSASNISNSSICSSHPLSLQCMNPELEHLESVCLPQEAKPTQELDFPCIQHSIISNQCYFGRTFQEIWNTTTGEFIFNTQTAEWTPQAPLDQRLCACESLFFDTLAGCSACYKAHGANIGLYYSEDSVNSMSSSYCAATSTPTVGLDRMLYQWDHRPEATTVLSSASAEAKTTSYSDPLAGKTAVTLYYTPALTGSAVFDIAGVTHGAKPTTTNVVNGQITANGASATEGGMAQIRAAFAGLVALAALVALL